MVDTINVSMNGEQYIEYLKIKKFKFNNKLIIFLKHSWIYFAIAICIAFVGIQIIDILFRETTVITYTVIKGLAIPNPLIIFIIICIGLAWVLHGFGFLIIKR